MRISGTWTDLWNIILLMAYIFLFFRPRLVHTVLVPIFVTFSIRYPPYSDMSLAFRHGAFWRRLCIQAIKQLHRPVVEYYDGHSQPWLVGLVPRGTTVLAPTPPFPAHASTQSQNSEKQGRRDAGKVWEKIQHDEFRAGQHLHPPLTEKQGWWS